MLSPFEGPNRNGLQQETLSIHLTKPKADRLCLQNPLGRNPVLKSRVLQQKPS